MRAAIIGCGRIAAVHAYALSKIKDVEICGFADVKIERATGFSKKYGGSAYETIEELIQGEQPETVHLCTPHFLHTPHTLLCLKNNIHVFVEKPLSISREEFALVSRQKGNIGICFQNRYNPEVKYIKKILMERRFGNILGARALVTWNRDANYYSEGTWRGTWAEAGGGALINQGIHTLDLMLYFLGEPTIVEAIGTNYHLKNISQVEDTLSIFLGYKNTSANIFITTGYCSDAPVFLEIICDQATIRLEGTELSLLQGNKRKRVPLHQGSAAKGEAYWGCGHAACISDFYQAVKEGNPPPIGISEATLTMETLFQIYEQMTIKTYYPPEKQVESSIQ